MVVTHTMPSSVKALGEKMTGQTHSIGIAGIDVVHAPDRIRTVLGSCIGVALFDCQKGIGGMAHVILPSSKEGAGDPGKFADTAVDILLERLIESGANPQKLEAKISGGSVMFGDQTSSSLGVRNEHAVKERLAHHGIKLLASDTGGRKGRRMLLDPSKGDVIVEIIGQEPVKI